MKEVANILDLKPAQIAIGLLEVDQRIKEYERLTKDEFHQHTDRHPVPVVKSSHGMYIIDHHHLCRAYHELGHRKVHVYQQADFSMFEPPKFWEMMEAAHWVLPQDQFGVRHPYHHLPIDIRGMADDPYRSLVRKLKQLGEWQKDPVPFAEFSLANVLRERVSIENTRESFDEAVKAAVTYLRASRSNRTASQ